MFDAPEVISKTKALPYKSQEFARELCHFKRFEKGGDFKERETEHFRKM